MSKPDKGLIRKLVGYYSDPLGFVREVFPWGQGLLAGEEGPDVWQAEVLEDLGRMGKESSAAVRLAVASGHGVGKTALISWIILWFMSTRAHPQIVVTANTRFQLETKTWRELAKWHRLSVNRDWFEWTSTKFYYREHRETWFAAAIPWSKERSEAFAGTHEKDVLFLYDEASLIDAAIWEVTEGAMTTPGAVWVVFGNPTRNRGRFRECFGRFRHRWRRRQVDARTAKMANQAQIREWIEDYGEDSDFVRVRVKGQFPRASGNQLIGEDLVTSAAGRSLHKSVYRHGAKVLGVDVARFGDDQSVVIRRQGLAVLGIKKYREVDTMRLASIVGEEVVKWRPDAVFIDEVGIGAGVVDRLRQLGFEVFGVNAGARAGDSRRYYNLRAEMWVKMRDWLKSGGAIPLDVELQTDLIGPEYGFDASDRLQLEKKEDMKKRGLASPDCADALALTFAFPVAARGPGSRAVEVVTEYDLFGPRPEGGKGRRWEEQSISLR